MQKVTLVPCHKYCVTDEFKQKHKVFLMQAEIPEDDKMHYNYCKWCNIFIYSTRRKTGTCQCCNRIICKVYRKFQNGKYYEY